MMVAAVILTIRHILMDRMMIRAIVLTALRVLMIGMVIRAVSSSIGIPSAAMMSSAAMVSMGHDRRCKASDAYKGCQHCSGSFFPVFQQFHIQFLQIKHNLPTFLLIIRHSFRNPCRKIIICCKIIFLPASTEGIQAGKAESVIFQDNNVRMHRLL